MKAAIALLIFFWALANTFDLPQHYAVPESQALSFNWFKQWRKKPAIPTPAPVMIPEQRTIVTPEHRPVMMPERKQEFRPISTSAPKPRWQIFPSQNNLSQQFKLLEDEVVGAKQNKSLFGLDHANRILKDLSNLGNSGHSKAEIERLRNVVYELTPDFQKISVPETASQNCIRNNPTLVADFTDFSKVQKITAPGTDSSEGPKGHSFIWTGGLNVPVYAPVGIILDSGAYVKDNASAPAQYILWFKVKSYCDFQVKFDHIDEPIEAIRQNFPSTPKIADSRGQQVTNKVEFRVGQLIGYTRGNTSSGNWDFGLYNMSKVGPLSQYGSQGSHRNAVCWTDFYSSEKRELYRRLLEGPRLLCSF